MRQKKLNVEVGDHFKFWSACFSYAGSCQEISKYAKELERECKKEGISSPELNQSLKMLSINGAIGYKVGFDLGSWAKKASMGKSMDRPRRLLKKAAKPPKIDKAARMLFIQTRSAGQGLADVIRFGPPIIEALGKKAKQKEIREMQDILKLIAKDTNLVINQIKDERNYNARGRGFKSLAVRPLTKRNRRRRLIIRGSQTFGRLKRHLVRIENRILDADEEIAILMDTIRSDPDGRFFVRQLNSLHKANRNSLSAFDQLVRDIKKG